MGAGRLAVGSSGADSRQEEAAARHGGRCGGWRGRLSWWVPAAGGWPLFKGGGCPSAMMARCLSSLRTKLVPRRGLMSPKHTRKSRLDRPPIGRVDPTHRSNHDTLSHRGSYGVGLTVPQGTPEHSPTTAELTLVHESARRTTFTPNPSRKRVNASRGSALVNPSASCSAVGTCANTTCCFSTQSRMR